LSTTTTQTAGGLEPVVARGPAAGVVAAGGVALLIGESQLRVVEATMAATIMRLTNLAHAHALGSSVFFQQNHQWIGYQVTAGCTAALLIAPFFFIGAGLLFFRRLNVGNTLTALAVVGVLIWVINQLRLLLIGASMRFWGFKTGYDRSHILAGGVLSTVGVTIGVVAFLAFLLRERHDLPETPRRDRDNS
jgi:exosortase/archaeosortase family protein